MELTEQFTFEQFVAEHGGNPVTVDGQIFYLPDGACFATAGQRGVMSFTPAPFGQKENLQARLNYADILLRQKRNELKQMVDAQNEQDSLHLRYPTNCPSSNPAVDEEIKSRADALVPLIEKHDKLFAEYSALPGVAGRNRQAYFNQGNQTDVQIRMNKRKAAYSQAIATPTVYQHELRQPLEEE